VVAESSDAVIDKMVVDKMAVLQMHSGQGIAAPPAGFTGTGIAANSNRPRANVSLPWNATKETNKHFPAPKAVAPAQVPVMTPQHMQEFGAQLKQPKIEPQQQMGGRSLPPKAPQQQLQPSVSQTSMQQQLFHLQQLQRQQHQVQQQQHEQQQQQQMQRQQLQQQMQRQQMAWEHQLEQQHKNKLLQQQVQRQAQHVAQQQAQVAHQQQLLNQQRIQVQQRQAAAAHQQQQQQQQQQPASSTANDRRWSGSTGSGGGDEFGDILDILNSSMPGNGESFTVPNGHSFTDLDVLRTFDSPALPHRELDLNLKATPKPKSRAVRPTVKAEPTAATSQVNKPASSRKGTGRKKAVKGGDALLHGYFGQFDQTGSETLSKLELEQLLSECALKDDGPPANSKYALFSTVRNHARAC
jgi:chemotaxis protein histidine kinase CheA